MLSRIIRSSALLMVFGFSASSAFLFLYQHQNLEESYREIDFSANILAHETSQKKNRNKKNSSITSEITLFRGANTTQRYTGGRGFFLEDFVSWGTILSVTTDKRKEADFS